MYLSVMYIDYIDIAGCSSAIGVDIRNTVSEMAIFNLYIDDDIVQTVSNIRPRLLLTLKGNRMSHVVDLL